jgi:hypothetical protein
LGDVTRGSFVLAERTEKAQAEIWLTWFEALLADRRAPHAGGDLRAGRERQRQPPALREFKGLAVGDSLAFEE